MKKYVGVILREAFIKKIWGRRGEVGDANSIIQKIQFISILNHFFEAIK